MARNKSAEKRNRQNEGLRERNRAYRSRMRSSIKKLRTLVESGDAAGARAALPADARPDRAHRAEGRDPPQHGGPLQVAAGEVGRQAKKSAE